MPNPLHLLVKLAYEEGEAAAMQDFTPDDMAFDSFPDDQYQSFSSVPRPLRGATWFGNNPGASGTGQDIPEVAPQPEYDLSELHNNIKLQDFADIPDDITISDPDQANKLISSGHNYVNQASEIYKYLLSQGMNAQQALQATRQHLSQVFERYKHGGGV